MSAKHAFKRANLRQVRPSWAFNQHEQFESRGFLRAILRETTYLPDNQARSFFRKYSVNRFRDHAPGNKSDDIIHERRLELIGQARKGLRALIRANAGEQSALSRILELTYGRRGRRRHELLRPLLSNTQQAEMDRAAENETAEEVDRDLGTAGSEERDVILLNSTKSETDLNPALLALIKSQIRVSPPIEHGFLKRQRNAKPEIPETNAWLRPMPQRRVAQAFRTWCREMFSRVEPPLARPEWERLKELSLGNAGRSSSIKRRTRVIPRGKCAEGFWFSVEREELLRDLRTKRESHEITNRYMKRRWRDVFQQCPVMEWDPTKREWSIEWGYTHTKAARVDATTVEGKHEYVTQQVMAKAERKQVVKDNRSDEPVASPPTRKIFKPSIM